MTERIQFSATSGRFVDGERMQEFARAFAGWYTRASESAGPVPRCWRATFEVAADHHLMILQHLLLGGGSGRPAA